ncbi:MAG: hypothetical protein K2Q18_06550, partial [Bdellovibrionales bacterium]|nr:hypothetical protein [Bdellovibrionales bacterium]
YANSEKGKETIKRVRNEYYQNNKEAENKRSLEWAEKNKEFVKEYNKEYNKIRKINDKSHGCLISNFFKKLKIKNAFIE